MTAPTPPAPTLAPGRERASALPLAEYLALADDLLTVRSETAGGGNRDTMTRAAEVIRILCAEAAALTAPLPAAPVAGAMDDAMDELLAAWSCLHFVAPLDQDSHRLDAARAALLDAHAAEVQAARAEGRAGREADADAVRGVLAAGGLSDNPTALDMILLSRANGGAAVTLAIRNADESFRACVVAVEDSAEAEELDRFVASRTDDARDADPPALVNGGPPTDALDDGR